MLMMNKQNLGSKESLGITFKGDVLAELCLKLWLKATGIVVILLS